MNLFIGALLNRKLSFWNWGRKCACRCCLQNAHIIPIERLRHIFYTESIRSIPEAKENKLCQCYPFGGLICETWTSIRRNFHLWNCSARALNERKLIQRQMCKLLYFDERRAFIFLDKFFFGNSQKSVIEWQHICSQLSMVPSSLINLWIHSDSFLSIMMELAFWLFKPNSKLFDQNCWKWLNFSELVFGYWTAHSEVFVICPWFCSVPCCSDDTRFKCVVGQNLTFEFIEIRLRLLN